MKTLQTTPKKERGLKGYSITAHNLKSCKYALNLTSKPSESRCGSVIALKFQSFEQAKATGEAFLNSDFTGIFANKEFARSIKK